MFPYVNIKHRKNYKDIHVDEHKIQKKIRFFRSMKIHGKIFFIQITICNVNAQSRNLL